jgi:hypothetical protein
MGWASALCPGNLWSYGFFANFLGRIRLLVRGLRLWTSGFAEIIEPLYTMTLAYPVLSTDGNIVPQLCTSCTKAGRYRSSVTVGRVSTARLLDMCGNHG